MKVKVNNFQSIKSAELEVKGLTVIFGENSTGKSAFARALSGVFTNARGDSYVRNGEKSLSVEVSFDDGNHLLWEKGKGVNQYTVNSKLISKVGSSVPDEVKEIGVHSVEVDGRDLHPQIAKQFQNIFLLDLPPSALSSALSDVDTIQKLEKASATARSEMRDIKGRLKVKREDLEEARNQSTHFHDFDYSLITKAEALEQEKNKSEALVLQVEGLSLKRNKISKAQEVLACSEVALIPHALPALPDIERISQLKKLRTRAYVTSMMVSVGLKDEDLPSTPSFPPVERIEKLIKVKNRLSQAVSVLKDLEELNLPDTPSQSETQGVALLEKKKKLLYGLGVGEGEVKKLSDEIKQLTSEIQKHTCPTCLRVGGTHEGH